MSTEPAPTAELSALDSRGIGMRIRFTWQGDFYGHQIDAIDGPLTRTLLESIEGDQLVDWPPSPPLQHVSVSWIASDTEQGHVAMLVGATSKGHWSMCVSARDRQTYPRNKLANTKLYLDGIYLDDEPDDAELFFDIACRVNDAPQFLGSTYRVLYQRVSVSESLNCAFVPDDALVSFWHLKALNSNSIPSTRQRLFCVVARRKFDFRNFRQRFAGNTPSAVPPVA